jgi:hypothetical protein
VTVFYYRYPRSNAEPFGEDFVVLWRDCCAIPEGGSQIKKQPRLAAVMFFIARYLAQMQSLLVRISCNKKPRECGVLFDGGERGIRTPGPVTVNGFQDRRIRPLCHLSFSKGLQN